MAAPYRNSFSGKGVFPPRYAFTLLIPLRSMLLSPGKLIQRLDIQEHHNVLEVGPGPGYFSSPVAKKLKRGYIKSSAVIPFNKANAPDVYGVINLNIVRKNKEFSDKDISLLKELINLTSIALLPVK